MRRRYGGPNYGYLRDLVERSLADCGRFEHHARVAGRLNRIGEGLWHENYWFSIESHGVPPEWADRTYVLRMLAQGERWQGGDEPLARLLREAETLQTLAQSPLPFPTPEFVCLVHHESQVVGMIETAVAGISMEHKQFQTESTLRTIGYLAAKIHRLPPQ
jgi:hypothetical protein